MIEFDRITSFEWDDGNIWKNYTKHDVSTTEAEQVLLNDPLVSKDQAHSGAEPRFHALGEPPTGLCLHVTFTLRHDDTRIRIISARAMNLKERRSYTLRR